MKENLTISTSPHIHSKVTTAGIMQGVMIALSPVVLVSCYYFRWRAVCLILVCIVSCLATEVLFQSMRRKKPTIDDCSAVVTGILLALILPPTLPLGIAVLGSVVAIALGKQIFGGLGYNIFNPALIGRAFLMAAFPVALTSWVEPVTLDAVTRATPLGLMKFEKITTPIVALFLGKTAGSLGETSALAIILGGIYLLGRKYADWRIPVAYIGTVIGLGTVNYLINPAQNPTPLFQLFAGGFMLGAFFMATDPVTSPVTKKGRWIFGCGAGFFLFVIRLWGGLPEGVMYSILLMNAFSPLINRLTRPRVLGVKALRNQG
jgi:electron transport complex protein RnfD